MTRRKNSIKIKINNHAESQSTKLERHHYIHIRTYIFTHLHIHHTYTHCWLDAGGDTSMYELSVLILLVLTLLKRKRKCWRSQSTMSKQWGAMDINFINFYFGNVIKWKRASRKGLLKWPTGRYWMVWIVLGPGIYSYDGGHEKGQFSEVNVTCRHYDYHRWIRTKEVRRCE